MTPETPIRIAEVPMARVDARRRRARARLLDERGDAIGAMRARAEADEMETAAAALVEPRDYLMPANGGEVVDRMDAAARPGLFLALRDPPDLLEARASMQRLELAGDHATLAVEMAESIGARDAAEKMIAHQLAAAHVTSMRLSNAAASFAARLDGRPWGRVEEQQAASVEAARLANAAARTMEAFQAGLLTLAKLRGGGQQTVTVQHVHVSDGGQAVVAGSVGSGRRGARRGGGSGG